MTSTDWLFLIGLLVATLLFTGPGLWSEKWGWGMFRRIGRRRGAEQRRDGRNA